MRVSLAALLALTLGATTRIAAAQAPTTPPAPPAPVPAAPQPPPPSPPGSAGAPAPHPAPALPGAGAEATPPAAEVAPAPYPQALPAPYAPPPATAPQGYGAYPTPPPPGAYLPAPAPDRIRRSGLTLGFGIGPGRISGGGSSDGGFAFDFHIGGMLAPDLALVFDYSGVQRNLNDFQDREEHSIATVALQHFLMRLLWVKAGVGFGTLSVVNAYGYAGSYSESSLAATLAAGVEVLQTTGGFAIDVQARMAGSRYNDTTVTNGALMLGFNWY